MRISKKSYVGKPQGALNKFKEAVTMNISVKDGRRCRNAAYSEGLRIVT